MLAADVHFHGPWAWYKENPREGPRTLENFAKHMYASGLYLDVVAYTNFNGKESMETVGGAQGFFHRFLLPTARDTDEYAFEVGEGGFNVDVTKKKGGERKTIILTQEIPTQQGHVLAIGALGHITPFKTAEETAKQIMDYGGVVEADHPTVAGGLDERTIRELTEKGLLHLLELDMALPYPLTRSYHKVVELSRKTGLPLARNSDGHSWGELSPNKATYFDSESPVTTADLRQHLLKAISAKQVGEIWDWRREIISELRVPKISLLEHGGRLARAVKHQYKTSGLPKKFFGKRVAGLIGCNTED